jgi:septal ring factor EnvC (AmiA/AmiB activator)
VRTALSLALAGFLLAGSAHAQDLGELRSRISTLEKKLGQNMASRNEAADALKASEVAISNSVRHLRALDNKERSANAELSRLHSDTDRVTENIRVQQALLGKLLYERYLGGEQEYLKLLLDAKDPNQATRNLAYLTYVSKERSSVLKSLRGNLRELDTLTASTKDKKAELDDILDKQRLQKKELEKEKAQRQAVLDKVSGEIGRQRKAIARLKRNEARLKNLVERIGRRASRGQIRNENVPDASFDNSPFRKLKGRLRLPVRGVLTNRFGAPRMNGRLIWKGLFIRAATGEEVHAIAAGQVVFADWLRGFGNIIIVDHGSGYMSLYGDNEALLKKVGDKVHGGEVIAEVGNSGGNEESGLYFELRDQGVPLDPMKWVTVK